ncbi:MAG TPA: hypothetical protein VG370_17275 [Chloroflexota bacterium]|jgi:hypothetical protein|nr:hypothetical protein [Chloroflexota bacterium]
MIGVADLARRLGSVVARGERRDRVTVGDVLAYLRPRGRLDEGVARLGDPIERAAAQLPRLIDEERLARRHRGFSRYFETMPRILFLYGRGYTPEEIAAEMPFLSSGYGVETVLSIVADAIARRVNRAAEPGAHRSAAG